MEEGCPSPLLDPRRAQAAGEARTTLPLGQGEGGAGESHADLRGARCPFSPELICKLNRAQKKPNEIDQLVSACTPPVTGSSLSTQAIHTTFGPLCLNADVFLIQSQSLSPYISHPWVGPRATENSFTPSSTLQTFYLKTVVVSLLQLSLLSAK